MTPCAFRGRIVNDSACYCKHPSVTGGSVSKRVPMSRCEACPLSGDTHAAPIPLETVSVAPCGCEERREAMNAVVPHSGDAVAMLTKWTGIKRAVDWWNARNRPTTPPAGS